MRTLTPTACAALALAAACLWAMPARAGQSYDNCTGTIDTLPAIISTQGTWCLKQNLTTSMNTGNAITIEGNNITIDCNDFKIGGLQAGLSTNANGIYAFERLNVTVRNCGIRGFRDAIWLNGAATFGALIEDNRFDNNTTSAIKIYGGGHLIRANRIVDTGGRPAATQTNAITLQADQSVVSDNVIVGITATAVGGDVVGIGAYGDANDISRHFISGLVVDLTGDGLGIITGAATGSTITGNRVVSPVEMTSSAIGAGAGNVCQNNLATGFTGAIGACHDAGGNVAH